MRCDRPLEPPERIALDDVDTVLLGRGPLGVERTAGGRELVIRIPDERMSTAHARLVRTGRAFHVEDLGSKNGTRVGGEPCTTAELGDGDVIEAGHTFFVFRARVPRGADRDPTIVAATAGGESIPLTTYRAGLARQFETLARVARSTLPVIVLGETGTGKEVVARALHRLSGRTGPFLAVNCGAIPASLIESELFGAKKGAFSGAIDDRVGLVRSADTGTLFLDEIGELPGPAQVALLRVLQEQEVMPIGATRPVKVDVRIVAATHRPLERLVDSSTFRADLYARLAGFTMRLPPLRDRRDDLGIIVASLLRRIAEGPGRVRLTRRAARALFDYGFPRNIRELEKALGFAVTIATDTGDGIEIDLEHLPEELREARPRPPATPPPPEIGAPLVPSDDEARKALLVELLAQHKGRVADVARAMGKARMQIHRWIQRYGVDLEAYRKS